MVFGGKFCLQVILFCWLENERELERLVDKYSIPVYVTELMVCE